MKCAIVLAVLGAGSALGEISYGGYTFDDRAFADRVEQNEPGGYHFNSAETLAEALLGFTPDSGLYNMGATGQANDFSLFFDDLPAFDIAGADIVLFDLRFSADDYEIAVISGGVQSGFLLYPSAYQTDTGEIQDDGFAQAFAIEIDLADYGVGTAEGIRFRSLPAVGAQGDPTMAGVLVPGSASIGLLVIGGLVGTARRR